MKYLLLLIITVFIAIGVHSQPQVKDAILYHVQGCKYTIVRDQKIDTIFTTIDFPITIFVSTRNKIDFKNSQLIPMPCQNVYLTTHDSLLIPKFEYEYVVFYEIPDTFITNTDSYESKFVIKNIKMIDQYFVEMAKFDNIYFRSKKKYCKNATISEYRKLVIYPK